MSLDRCVICHSVVDTDMHPDAYCEQLEDQPVCDDCWDEPIDSDELDELKNG